MVDAGILEKENRGHVVSKEAQEGGKSWESDNEMMEGFWKTAQGFRQHLINTNSQLSSVIILFAQARLPICCLFVEGN